jgi:hypothetical protein
MADFAGLFKAYMDDERKRKPLDDFLAKCTFTQLLECLTPYFNMVDEYGETNTRSQSVFVSLCTLLLDRGEAYFALRLEILFRSPDKEWYTVYRRFPLNSRTPCRVVSTPGSVRCRDQRATSSSFLISTCEGRQSSRKLKGSRRGRQRPLIRERSVCSPIWKYLRVTTTATAPAPCSLSMGYPYRRFPKATALCGHLPGLHQQPKDDLVQAVFRARSEPVRHDRFDRERQDGPPRYRRHGGRHNEQDLL